MAIYYIIVYGYILLKLKITYTTFCNRIVISLGASKTATSSLYKKNSMQICLPTQNKNAINLKRELVYICEYFSYKIVTFLYVFIANQVDSPVLYRSE